MESWLLRAIKHTRTNGSQILIKTQKVYFNKIILQTSSKQ